MDECGLSHAQAGEAYESVCRVFEDAIIAGRKINIGNICAINPEWQEARPVHMGFKRTKEGVEKTSTVFYLGRRIRYKVSIFKEFINSHQLNWF
jgi:hypothetical protein